MEFNIKMGFTANYSISKIRLRGLFDDATSSFGTASKMLSEIVLCHTISALPTHKK